MSLKEEANRIALEVNSMIEETLKGRPTYLYDASSHMIKAGGKRLRPFMALKFHSLYSGDEKEALPAAASLELVHNFTLIHDDIMDRDDIRHGVSTVHKEFGEPLAILAGDVLFAKAFDLVIGCPALKMDFERMNSAVKLLADSLIVLCEGQAIDVMAASGEIYTEEQYYEIIQKKTSALFEASAVMGVLTGGGSMKDREEARAFARDTGMAFQMVDDLLGVAGDAAITGKPVGGDLKEGKKTLPIVLAIERSDEQQRKLLYEVWGNAVAKQEDVERAVSVLRNLGIDDEVRGLADRHVERAIDHLNSLPEHGRSWLVDLAHFMAGRKI